MAREKTNCAALLCCGWSLGGLFAGVATAQQSRSDTGQLEEIVVTAEKREATIETTAISLTAVSGADIVNRGFTDLASLMQTVPGVSLRTSGPGMTEFEMRGVASNGGNSPTVGFYFDETPLTAPAATNEGKIVISPDLYDLNRVEVLRGPQGTLYGSGSMGGTIRVIPNAPNPELFEASGEVKFADTDHGGFDHGENAMVNLPFFNGIAALRIVGSYSYDAGWIDRVVIAPGQFPLATGLVMTGPTSSYYSTRGNVLAAPIATEYHDVNDVEKTTVRISAVFKPIDGLTITPSYFYQKTARGRLALYRQRPRNGCALPAVRHSRELSRRVPSLGIEHQVPHGCLRDQLGERLLDSARAAHSGRLGVVVDRHSNFPRYGPGNGGIGAAYADEDNQSHQTTEELRISSVGDTRLKWLAGYFYSDFESGWDIIFPSQTGAQVFGTSNSLFDYYSPFKILQQSVFGEVTYNITEPFAVTVGARRYHYDAPVGLDQYGALLGTLTPTFTSTSENDQGVTPKVSLSYQFDKDLLAYATAAKGFRPGGGTGPVPTSGPQGVELRAAIAGRVRLQGVHQRADLVQLR